MAARKPSSRGKEPNGNGRVTMAVLGTKVDAVATDVKGLRAEHDQHVTDGTAVYQRLSALEGKWMVLAWGTPIMLTAITLVTGIVFALSRM